MAERSLRCCLSQALSPSNPADGDAGSQRGLLWWVLVVLGLTPAIWVPRALPCRRALTQPLSTGVSVHVCNEQRYGYLNVPVKSHQGLEDERVNFIHLILEALGEAASRCCPSTPSLPAPSHGPLLLGPGPGWAGGRAGVTTSPSNHSLTPGKSLSLLSFSLPLRGKWSL